MGRPVGSKNGSRKDEFSELDDEFKDAVAGSNEEQIRHRISVVALQHAELMQAKENDEDLANAKEVAKEAGAVYSEGAKASKLKIKFCKRVLDDRGIDTSGLGKLKS